MRWNLRMAAAEQGIWKSSDLKRRLGDAGLEISAGKMSSLWAGAPQSIRLDDLDIICAVLKCDPTHLLVREIDDINPSSSRSVAAASNITPRLGRHRSVPPA